MMTTYSYHVACIYMASHHVTSTWHFFLEDSILVIYCNFGRRESVTRSGRAKILHLLHRYAPVEVEPGGVKDFQKLCSKIIQKSTL